MLQGLGQLRDKAKQLAKADATVLVLLENWARESSTWQPELRSQKQKAL
jgi:hypothetical protein